MFHLPQHFHCSKVKSTDEVQFKVGRFFKLATNQPNLTIIHFSLTFTNVNFPFT